MLMLLPPAICRQSGSEGDEVRQWDGDWPSKYLRQSNEIKARLCQEPNEEDILWDKMPRNPAHSKYEQQTDLSEKAAFLKSLMNLYQGEVRVVQLTTGWVQVHAELPKHHAQYAPEFLRAGYRKDEHWRRGAMGLSLPHMLDIFRTKITATVRNRAGAALAPPLARRSRSNS